MKKSFFVHFILFITACVLVLTSLPVFAEDSYTYESEFAKLPDEIKSMSNIRLVDDHDEGVVQKNCGDNKSPDHFYGSSYFTGNSGASLTYEFEGTVIGVLVEKGGFDVYLDEEFVGTYCISARSDRKAQFVYYNDQLADDYHVIYVVTNKEAAVENTGDQYSLFRGFIIQDVPSPSDSTKAPTTRPTEAKATEAPTPTRKPSQEPEYTYESEFAKLPDEIKAMSNILLVDDHDEGVVQKNCGDNKSPDHFYGSSYFTGNSGASLTYEFEGTVIGVLVEKGGFDVYLDEEFVGTYCISARSDRKAQFVYYNDQLANDYHVISVVSNKDAAMENTGDQYSLFRGFIVQKELQPGGATKAPTERPTEGKATDIPVPTHKPATEEYTYESEFAKLPDEIKSMENIYLIDDHDIEVIQQNCGDNESPDHFYGSSYFTGNSGASLTLEFEDSVIGVLVEKGGFDIYLDEEFAGTFSVSSRSDRKAQFVYYNDQLANDYHIISVVANKDAAMENTGDQYSLFRGFIVQNEVQPGGATKAPADNPTDAAETEAPDVTDSPVKTAEPTQAPQKTSVPQATDAGTKADKASDGSKNILLIILIILAVLVIAASLALIMIKNKKK